MRKSKKIYEQVAEHIKEQIEKGHLQPGDKLPPMNDLALQFGVSRATVREAFSSLVGMGLIDLRHGEGTFVQRIDVQTMITEPMNAAILLGLGDMRELLEMRKLLETGAVSAACERATTEQLARMEEALLQLEKPLLNVEERVSADLQFHLAIAEAAGNTVLLNVINTLSETIRSILHILWQDAGDRKRLFQQHKRLYEAIVAQDKARAVHLMETHLERSEQLVIQFRSE